MDSGDKGWCAQFSSFVFTHNQSFIDRRPAYCAIVRSIHTPLLVQYNTFLHKVHISVSLKPLSIYYLYIPSKRPAFTNHAWRITRKTSIQDIYAGHLYVRHLYAKYQNLLRSLRLHQLCASPRSTPWRQCSPSPPLLEPVQPSSTTNVASLYMSGLSVTPPATCLLWSQMERHTARSIKVAQTAAYHSRSLRCTTTKQP